MKKIKVLITLFCLGIIFHSNNLQSQNWAPVGATWYYGFSGFMVSGYYKISYIGDTTINSIPCKILEKKIFQYSPLSGFDTITLNQEYTYSDANKVYIYRFNNFYTLYDFSANIGDSIMVPGNNQYSFEGCDSVGYVKVDSIGTMVINGLTLRYISVSPTSTSQWGWKCRIVEKIGPLYNYLNNAEPYNYLFPNKLDYCGMQMDELHEGGFLRCYTEQNGFSYHEHSYTSDCDYIFTEINEIVNTDSDIKVFPNPTNNIIKIAFNLNLKQSVQISLFDIMGKLIFYKNIPEAKIVNESIDLSNYPSGLYLIKLKANNQKTIIKKISKY